MGLGEAYMDGWWDCPALDQFSDRIFTAKLNEKVSNDWRFIVRMIQFRMMNRQSPVHAYEVAERHYDIGNDLYRAMLDPTMTYSCGYWKNATNLAEAQEHKLDLICRKIGLQSGHTVLDIGCGWGGFARFAAEHYGATVTGITVSKEQAVLAKERCKGMPVDIVLEDYRELQGQYDRVVSVGMFEHVGDKNYETYMNVVHRCLKEDGLFLLHTIGNAFASAVDPWTERYIFPNSMLPAISQIALASERKFVMEDWHNFGADYDKTLMAWFHNFDHAWPNLKEAYGDRFYRMWTFYLLMCAGIFRARSSQLWQIVLSKNGVRGGYESVR